MQVASNVWGRGLLHYYDVWCMRVDSMCHLSLSLSLSLSMQHNML